VYVRLSTRDRLNIADHWTLLDERQRNVPTERVARMMQSGRDDLRTSWALRPGMTVSCSVNG